MHGKPAGLCVAVKSQLCFIQTIDSCVWIPYNKTGKMILARFCVRENSLIAISVGLDFYGKLFVRGRLMIFCSLRGINSIEAFHCSQTEVYGLESKRHFWLLNHCIMVLLGPWTELQLWRLPEQIVLSRWNQNLLAKTNFEIQKSKKKEPWKSQNRYSKAILWPVLVKFKQLQLQRWIVGDKFNFS